MTFIAKTTGAAVVAGPISRWPWYLVQAVSKGLQVASWMENLPPDELPPQEIWHHEERLNVWFEQVKFNREKKYAPDGQQFESVPGAETIEFDVADEIENLR